MVIDSGGENVDIGTPEDVRAVLVECFGNKTKAARKLGFQSVTHFSRFLERHKKYRDACNLESVREEVAGLWAHVGQTEVYNAAVRGERWAVTKILNDQCASLGWGSHDRSVRAASAPAQTQTAQGRDLVALFTRPPTPTEEPEEGAGV